jgi:hypothetical protein
MSEQSPLPPEPITPPAGEHSPEEQPVQTALMPSPLSTPPAASPSADHGIGEWSIARLIDQLLRHPRQTWRQLNAYMQADTSGGDSAGTESGSSGEDGINALHTAHDAADAVDGNGADSIHSVDGMNAVATADKAEDAEVGERRDVSVLALRLLGVVLALISTSQMAFASLRTEETALIGGLPFLLAGLTLWIIAEWRAVRTASLSSKEHPETPQSGDSVLSTKSRITDQIGIRVGIGLIAALCGAGAFLLSNGNQFRIPGVVLWIACVVLTVWTFAPQGWTVRAPFARWLRQVRTWTPRLSWVSMALIILLMTGAVFRLTDLSGVPPEMTSDHVEKLLDSNRVYEGAAFNIFFQNNGGREPLQMYVMALFVRLTGLPMDFDTLKLLTALEGLITIPVMFWLGRELVGRHDRRLGIVVGLALAGLVAVSYWHVALSRLALRIVYTPFITAILFIYLSRALRDNRRIDFINAGLALGVSLYMYQVARMLPVVVVAGVALAVVFFVRGWVEKRRMLLNFVVLVLVSFSVFVPLFRFSMDYPDDFWRRSSGRLFGDALTQTTDEQGNMIEREPTLGEQLAAFQANLPQLAVNVRNALLMFNWKGDVAWINAAPNRPAFDVFSGALLIVGLGGWIGWIWRRRDPALWLTLPAFLILILPSALAIAYPIENPSATRMSGTLPFVYLWAAFGLSLLCMGTLRLGGKSGGAVLATLTFAGMIAFSYNANAQTYLVQYRESYLGSSKPYSDVGELVRVFATQEGSYGNAFMIAYPYWWDHRAIGIEAGNIDWPNGIISLEQVPDFLRESAVRADAFVFDPNLPMLFIYSPDDLETEVQLRQWFPQGIPQIMQTSHAEDSYRIFRIPPIGTAAFEALLRETS